MYENGRTTLILKAAISYLESEYFQIARGLLQKVIKIDRSNATAKFLFLYASAYNCYLQEQVVHGEDIRARSSRNAPGERDGGLCELAARSASGSRERDKQNGIG